MLRGVLQQDAVTAHACMEALQDVFCDRVISSDLWPRSRDLIASGFYLWGSLHDKVYKNSHTLEELRNSFRCDIKGICGEELQRANTNVFGRYTRLFWQQGNIQSQLQHWVWLHFVKVTLTAIVYGEIYGI